MTEQEFKQVTAWLIDNIIRNPDIMFSDGARVAGKKFETFNTNSGYHTFATAVDLVSVIVYLHNQLSEAITGKPYNYMFHRANKVGSGVEDNGLQECKYIVDE